MLCMTIIMLICDMGNERAYREGRQFSSYEYTTVSARVTINGVSGKMIEKKSDFKDPRNSLPSHSDTSDVYFAPIGLPGPWEGYVLLFNEEEY